MSERPPGSPEDDPSLWNDDDSSLGDQPEDECLAHVEPPPPPPSSETDAPPPPPRPMTKEVPEELPHGQIPQLKSLPGLTPMPPFQGDSVFNAEVHDWPVRKWGDIQSPPPDDPRNLLGNGFSRR